MWPRRRVSARWEVGSEQQAVRDVLRMLSLQYCDINAMDHEEVPWPGMLRDQYGVGVEAPFLAFLAVSCRGLCMLPSGIQPPAEELAGSTSMGSPHGVT